MSQQFQMRGILEKKRAAKIIGIQFSILSPDEIRKGSVAEISSREGYVNNKPVINGVFDPRMGVLEPGFICPTDGLTSMQTPGYFGHIELARPIFYLQYINFIERVLKSVCIKCSKLLLNKEVHRHILHLTPAERSDYVMKNAYTKRIKRCGQETDDGCGCLQPTKIKKESFCKLTAEWGTGTDIPNLHLTPEIVLKCFRRISNEDVNFMGFNAIYSRPDWMICQVLAVPPPAVRPSVKQDAQQRSEDDLTHAMINIIKTNKLLQDKMANKERTPQITASIESHTELLQHFVATLVDNKVPGTDPVMQRSGRPIKSIKERLNGKHGRVRGNLMGKRVDFSARSVITPDPNLSIRDLGVPMKIAKNITTPEVVNARNKDFLQRLVQNGPDIHPGAKMYQDSRRLDSGIMTYLRTMDRSTIKLKEGDIVHRHILDGDAVLFNRQPTLHRMSMMCHIARIMPVGDTFRMNVGDTKPYNADFDGDEMNLHMPQDIESTSELLNLAAVPWQLISPTSNRTIIGIFQDSLLGSYQFTRANVSFTSRAAMNMTMGLNNVNIDLYKMSRHTNLITNFDILSQILPPLSLNQGKDPRKVEIINGKIIKGQLDKSALADGKAGIIHRICNDFGNMAAVSFIDDLQNIVTDYMKISAYSVGVSDLLVDARTKNDISQILYENRKTVNDLIDQTHLGIFENKTGQSNEQAFDAQVINLLNKATSETSNKVKVCIKAQNNRFATMVEAGSKGSDINISQMIACLGQQTIEGKRVPYGFENRTLPHFTKFDDSATARGFVENSFISGLLPQELFFHAMGGRMGIIDTAVKTSQTGYIQRRLIKGMEDLKIEYDMTVRNNKNRIVQFSYGEDSFDTVKVEDQYLPLSTMTLEDIYAHVQIPVEKDMLGYEVFTKEATRGMEAEKGPMLERMKKLIDEMVSARDNVVQHVFGYLNDDVVHVPVAFKHLINHIQNQQLLSANSIVDITPYKAMVLIDEMYERLVKLHYSRDGPTPLFKTLYYFYVNPRELLCVKRFNRKTLVILLETILLTYKRAFVAPGEMVGIIAAQSIGEPTTQMTLNTFHLAGVASKSTVTRGLPRMEEILDLRSEPKEPSCTIYLLPQEQTDQANAIKIRNRLEHTCLRSIVDSVQICFDPNPKKTVIEEDKLLLQQFHEFEDNFYAEGVLPPEAASAMSSWVIRLSLNAEEMLDRNLTMEDVNFALHMAYSAKTSIESVYSDYNSDNLIFRLRLSKIITTGKKLKVAPLDNADEIYKLKIFQDSLLDNLVLRGIKHIKKVIPRKQANSLILVDGSYVKKETWVLDTVGSNLMELLALDYIDTTRTVTNNIKDIKYVLGIEAARQSLYNEIVDIIDDSGNYINYHHLSLLCDRMTCIDKMSAINSYGINGDDIGPIAKASFEETPKMFLNAARLAELDNMRGVSANVMCGQEGYFGTNSFQVLLDLTKTPAAAAADADMEEPAALKMDECSIENLKINNNVMDDADIARVNMDLDMDLDKNFLNNLDF